MEGRGAVCTRRTGAVALRGSERAKGGREQREWGSNCAHKVLGLLANSQTYTLGSIPSPQCRLLFSFRHATDLCLINKNQVYRS